jgi:hypothetical protein
MAPCGDSTVYFSRIGDRHLRYPGKLRSTALVEGEVDGAGEGKMAVKTRKAGKAGSGGVPGLGKDEMESLCQWFAEVGPCRLTLSNPSRNRLELSS